MSSLRRCRDRATRSCWSSIRRRGLARPRPPTREASAPPARDVPAQEGSGTVLAVILVGAMLILLPLALGLYTAVQANQRARAAADLGAIAAVAAYVGGVDASAACRRGARLVLANDARPGGCRISADGRAAISAVVGVRLPVLGYRTTSITSWAGPRLPPP